jgi:hypothetical protein
MSPPRCEFCLEYVRYRRNVNNAAPLVRVELARLEAKHTELSERARGNDRTKAAAKATRDEASVALPDRLGNRDAGRWSG